MVIRHFVQLTNYATLCENSNNRDRHMQLRAQRAMICTGATTAEEHQLVGSEKTA